jgi:hypothetical protein
MSFPGWQKIQPNLTIEEFPCNQSQKFRSKTRPTSVHRLMPGDIDVIAALGDSLTAGYGATATVQAQVAIENRGVGWSMGKVTNDFRGLMLFFPD